MNPAVISAGVGLLSSVFGARPKTPGYVSRNYELQNSIMKRGLDLYDGTDLAALDDQAVGAYSDTAMQQAMQLLQNYDAKAAAAGSPMWKGDTAKARARGQIGADAGQQIGQLRANLISSRPGRKAALLPSSQGAAAAYPAAAYLDNQAQGESAAQMQGLLDAANLVGSLWPTKGASGADTRNDRFRKSMTWDAAKRTNWSAAF